MKHLVLIDSATSEFSIGRSAGKVEKIERYLREKDAP